MGNNRLYEGNKYKIEKVVIHPDYPGSSRDIAVLKLKEKVTFNTRLKPICMPSGGPEAGLRCYVTGWGRTEIGGRKDHITFILLIHNSIYIL